MLVVARALEEGRLHGVVARALGSVWARIASSTLVRPLAVPPGLRVVVVGGATLGGSGTTPLVIACAQTLASEGVRVAVVGHAYRGRPGGARVVSPDDDVRAVGDEALVGAIELRPLRVPVVVAPSRGEALALAARVADVAVVDGVVQARPRAALALLAVDAEEPWGAGAVPPCGDLRAPRAELLGATDRVVAIGEGEAEAVVVSEGVRVDGSLRLWDEVRGLRVGLAVALGRPGRLLAMLERRGVIPVAVARARDHHDIHLRALRPARPVDMWIASRKCALHVPPATRSAPGAPLGVIDYRLTPGPGLRKTLLGLATA